jgi:hypothetical protein
MKKPTYDYITKEAPAVGDKWTLKNKVRFHYFNPNGLYTRKRRNDDAISRLVSEGKAKSGAIVAYGTFASQEADNLNKMLRHPRVTQSGYNVTVSMLREHCESQERAIARYESETVPSETVPSETVPSETVPSETVPSETVPAPKINWAARYRRLAEAVSILSETSVYSTSEGCQVPTGEAWDFLETVAAYYGDDSKRLHPLPLPVWYIRQEPDSE